VSLLPFPFALSSRPVGVRLSEREINDQEIEPGNVEETSFQDVTGDFW